MKKWRKKDIKDAKDFGGKVTPRSGGYFSFPGDVVTEDFLIDSKTTDKRSFSITESMWKKVSDEALKSRRLPCLSISLSKYDIDLVVLDKNDFMEFLTKGGEIKT